MAGTLIFRLNFGKIRGIKNRADDGRRGANSTRR
jgi:hypothetical protein